MDRVLTWWKSGLSPWVKLVYLVLMANGVPAFIILMSVPGMTDNWFVWTVKPDVSARLLGVMYGNALLLVVLGLMQRHWVMARITLVVITFFSFAATLVTFFNLEPFLKHPWYHLAYWLSMYLVLFFLAPVVFFIQERAHGGRLPEDAVMSPVARPVAALSAVALLLLGLGLLISPQFMSGLWPWNLTPLVGRIVGVWFSALGLAYIWALWDGDWLRTRLIFWQAPPTGLLLGLVPMVHSSDIKGDAGGQSAVYMALALGFAAANLAVILTEQRAHPIVVEARRGES